MTTKYHVVLADIHYPEHDAKALKVVFEFVRKNRRKIASVTLLGDALDCANLSRHTKGKPRLRKHRGYKQDLDGFKAEILEPIEQAVLPACKLTYICGNHEDWIESDLLDEMPELDGIVNIPDVLRLEEHGWRWVPVGGHIERAGFILLHGDQIGSGIHVAKKMVDSVNENCIMGHVHRYSVFSKAALVTERKKQLGTTLPCLCTVAPAYAKNQPNAFVVGFGILEEWKSDRANLYVPIIMDGKFSFGGVVYGHGPRRVVNKLSLRRKFIVSSSVARILVCWVLEVRNPFRDIGTQDPPAYREGAVSCCAEQSEACATVRC